LKKNSTPDTEWEVRVGYPNRIVVGVDEVGRGCLAGPVVASAVVLPSVIDLVRNPWLEKINDSKKLSPEMREELSPRIQDWAFSFGIGLASVEEIDRINIHHASHLAMMRAIDALNFAKKRLLPEHVLVDGKFAPKGLSCGATAIIKGDSKSLSIACASIIAKVWRDQHMAELDSQFPGYGFAVHKGYFTPVHIKALHEKGVCDIHRRSFRPVAERMQRGAELSLPSASL